MPELIVYSDENEYDVQTYIQHLQLSGLFDAGGSGQACAASSKRPKSPAMSIRAMAAGRVSPYVGLSFSYATLRPCDMVTVGAFTPWEVHEDVEIAMAALEHRFPNLEGRSSPNKTVALGGQVARFLRRKRSRARGCVLRPAPRFFPKSSKAFPSGQGAACQKSNLSKLVDGGASSPATATPTSFC